jgi:hypothetical protein
MLLPRALRRSFWNGKAEALPELLVRVDEDGRSAGDGPVTSIKD